MFEFTSQFRRDPLLASPTVNGVSVDTVSPVSPAVLQQLTSVAQEFDELANTCLLLLHLEVSVNICILKPQMIKRNEYNFMSTAHQNILKF